MLKTIITLAFLALPAFCIDCSSYATSKGFTPGVGFGNATVRYREVPAGICELTDNVRSYAGYVDISEHEHMFFWFFEARNMDPESAPLTAWISGGPGDSSMAELFTEHGPCRVRPDGETLAYNPFSWSNYSNVLYIDQPVQVGFSYTDLVPAYLNDDETEIVEMNEDDDCPDDAEICGCFSKPDTSTTATSTEAAAPNFWVTLQSFMATFPQYSSNGFHFGSESYGGHYVPVFSKYIQDQNSLNIQGASHIDLQSILVGNGWFSPQLQTESYITYGYDHPSTYGLKKPDSVDSQKIHDAYYGEGKCLDQLKHCEATGDNDICEKADTFCGNNVEGPFLDLTNRDDNDVREIDPSPFPSEFYSDYLQIPDVRKAIGAAQTYIELNPTVGDAFDSTGDDARELGILNLLGELVEQDVRVTLYAGDADFECNWLGVEAVANNVSASGFSSAGYTDVLTPDNVVHGQVKQSGLFSFVRVYEAGHAVGAFQPFLQQTIFARTLAGLDLATGKVSACAGYQSAGPKEGTYVEGNATVQYKPVSDSATYNYTDNKPSLEDFEPFWPGPIVEVKSNSA